MANIVLALYLGTLVLLSQQAHAYLDPGNGSMLLQVLLGGVAGLGVLFKYYWRQIASFFTVKKSAPGKDNQ